MNLFTYTWHISCPYAPVIHFLYDVSSILDQTQFSPFGNSTGGMKSSFSRYIINTAVLSDVLCCWCSGLDVLFLYSFCTSEQEYLYKTHYQLFRIYLSLWFFLPLLRWEIGSIFIRWKILIKIWNWSMNSVL